MIGGKKDSKTEGFFLKIVAEESYAREASKGVRGERKKRTVRFPYNEFVPIRGFKNVVELSKI